jgi:hypothetical protein
MTKKEQLAQEAKNILLNGYNIKASDTIQIVIKSVSKSWMCRRMEVYFNNKRISYWVANLCDLYYNESGLKINGCGMDMTLWLADTISYYLFWRKNEEFRGNGWSCIDWVVL